MSKLPTAEFNEGWEEGRHSADVEVMQLRAEIERLRSALREIRDYTPIKDITARNIARRALEGK